MIDGVRVKELKFVKDNRGRLIEILRADDEIFIQFGQVYMTTAKPGIIKAWHGHNNQTDSITCIKGSIKLVLYDDRQGSKTEGEINEFGIGEENPKLIQIPPKVWHGFKNVGADESLVINVPTLPYDHNNPDELRRPIETVDYTWDEG